ncbi:MAG: response regulator [Cyclobacteriaceae bacterium]|jgi:CheY-like chemotaxis protein|nr:response regulator [Cyclobacteriaceae bacterium]
MKKKPLIAVFENDPLNRFICQRMLDLQNEKVSFHIFGNPEEGLEIAKTINFDFVFIDLHFKGEIYGGIDLAKKFKSISKDTVLVAMTTLIQQRDSERAKSEGFVTTLEKPLSFYDIEKLLDGIER